MSLEFLITALVLALIPGTGVIYTLSNGLLHKWHCGIVAAVGCTLGIVPHLLACILGLSAIMHMSANVFVLIKMLGAAYLLYLAYSMWVNSGEIALQGNAKQLSAGRIILKGIALNLLNPKLTIFFLSFLPQFITAGTGSATLEMITLGLIFMLVTLIVFVMYALLAGYISNNLKNLQTHIKTVQKSFAVIFATLAIKLALTDRD